MSTESGRIADQLRRAFTGDPWYGPPLRQLLTNITPEQASVRVQASHSIAELVAHMDTWISLARNAAEGAELPDLYGTPQDWPAPMEDWPSATRHLFESAESLGQAIEKFPAQKLLDTVPGREYTFYHLFHGVVQHCVYHGGQIAILPRMH